MLSSLLHTYTHKLNAHTLDTFNISKNSSCEHKSTFDIYFNVSGVDVDVMYANTNNHNKYYMFLFTIQHFFFLLHLTNMTINSVFFFFLFFVCVSVVRNFGVIFFVYFRLSVAHCFYWYALLLWLLLLSRLCSRRKGEATDVWTKVPWRIQRRVSGEEEVR